MNYKITGQGIPVLFIHGIPTNHHLWDITISKIKPKYQFITVDLPGMGISPPLKNDSLSPSDYAVALEKLRRQLSISAWHIVGHDAGATIAVHYAAKFKEKTKSLTLCAPPIYPELQIPKHFRPLRKPIIGEILAPILKFIIFRIGLPLLLKPTQPLERSIVKSFQQSYRGAKGTKRLLHILRWGEPKKVLAKTAQLIPTITVPTLILQGKNDKSVPVEFAVRASKSIKKSKLYLLDGPHFFPLKCVVEFHQYLYTFLDEN